MSTLASGYQVREGAGLWMALAGGSMWMMSNALAERLPDIQQPTRHPCTGKKPKTFNVSLINLPLFVNRFGDVVPGAGSAVTVHTVGEAALPIM